MIVKNTRGEVMFVCVCVGDGVGVGVGVNLGEP